MRVVYIAFCHSEEDTAFKERTWEIVKIFYLNGQNGHFVFAAETTDYCEARALSKLYGT